jgi:hypothetical protein
VDKYSASGNGNTTQDPQSNLQTGASPIRIYNVQIGFESIFYSGGVTAPAGWKYYLRLALTNGSAWAHNIVPTPLDASAPASATTLFYGGAGVNPSGGGVYVQFPVYYKGSINWQAKKGKEITIAASSGCILNNDSPSPSLNYNLDYCFSFEE